MLFSHEGPADGFTNMLRDAQFLERAEDGRAACRVYSWTGPWVSLGRFQSPVRDLLPESGVPHVMRPTGGKAVLHGHDVTVGLAKPLQPGEARQIKPLYRCLIEPIVGALRECGLPAALGEETRFLSRGPRVADCFAHVSANDVVDERTGVKVCGCALRVTDRAVLLQASIPVGSPLIDPATVIKGGKQTFTVWDQSRFGPALERFLLGTWAAVS